MDWCTDVGIEFPGQKYPSYFNNGSLLGVRATQPIQYRQAYLKVPYNCLMTVSEAHRDPYLARIIRKTPALFSEDEQTGWRQHILALYMLLEWQKGDDSFWKQYLDSMPPAQFFCHWNEANIAEVQDKSLIIQTIEHREDITYQWSLFKECLRNHSYIF